MLCPKCGTANPDGSRECFNCGQPLAESPDTLHDGRLKAPRWGDEPVPDWLTALQANLPEELRDPALERMLQAKGAMAPKPGEPPVPDRHDAEEDTTVAGEVPAETAMSSDEWFHAVLSSMRQDFVVSADSDEPSETQGFPQAASPLGPQEFPTTVSPGSAEPGSEDDWLRSFRAEMQNVEASAGELGLPEEAGRDIPDWLQEMPFTSEETTPETASASPGRAQSAGREVPDEGEELSTWHAELQGSVTFQPSSAEGHPIPVGPQARPSSEVPDWLQDLTAPSAEVVQGPMTPRAAVPQQAGGQEEEGAELPLATEPSMPEWLTDYAIEPTEPTTPTERPAPEAPAEPVPSAPSPTETSGQPTAATRPGFDENVPEWLRDSLQEAFEEASPAFLESDRDLAASDMATTATIPLSQVKPGEAPAETADMPEWLRQLRAQEKGMEETQLPSWLTESEIESEPGTLEEGLPQIQEETPAWLWSAGPSEETESMEVLEPGSQRGQSPDWLGDMSAVPEEPAEQFLEIDEREVPDWLKQLGGAAFDEGSTQEELAHTQVIRDSGAQPPAAEPATLQSVTAQPPPSRAEVATEAMPSVPPPGQRAWRGVDGPEAAQLKEGNILAGIGAALAAPTSHALLKPEGPVTTEAIIEGSERASVFQEIVSQPLIAGEPPQRRRKRSRFWPAFGRAVLSLLIFAAVALTLYWQGAQDIGFFHEYNMPISPRTQAVYNQISAVPERSPVLIIADYEPSLAEELNVQARTLLESLIRRQLKILVVSTAFTGPQVMQEVVEDVLQHQAASYQYGEDYVNLGYLPAHETSLLLFGQDPLSAVRVDFKNRADLKAYPLASALGRVPQEGLARAIPLIVYLGGNEESLRLWIEQVIARQPDARMIVGVSAGLEPYTYPYLGAGQLAGVLSGLTGAAEYESLTQSPGRAVRSIDSQAGVHLLIVGLVILGNIVYALGRIFGRR